LNDVPHFHVTEDTLNEIIGRSEPIPAERFSRTLEMLQALYGLAFFYIRVSSRQVRTDLAKGIKDFRREIKQLDAALSHHRWILEPLRLATLDKWLHEKLQSHTSTTSRVSELIHPSQIVVDLEASLKQLTIALTYLERMVQYYDRLTGSANLLEWITENGVGQGQFVRAELSSYFAKGGGINADTRILRNIAELYKYAFEREFSIDSAVSSAKYNEELGDLFLASNEPSKIPRKLISDYSGPALDFACAVIHSLQLRAAFLRQPSDDRWDRRNISLLGKRAATDLELSNKIGDLWTADMKRTRKASKSVNSSDSSKASQD
jgi:hypothetical protein